jgi:hypothetical protein
VNASTDVDGDLRMMRVGIALAREGLEVALAKLVRIIDHPRAGGL